MALRAVIFDLWGTLIVDDPAVGAERWGYRVAATREALAALGHDRDDDAIQQAYRDMVEEHGRIHAGCLDISAEARTVLFLRHLDGSLAERLDDDGWRRLHQAVLAAPARSIPPRPMPGASEALEALRQLGLPVALISNAGITPGFVLRELLHDFGLLNLLDVTIFSDEAELAKPAPAIFARALDELDVAPGEAAFVGDQPVLDVLGPRNAGLWSVQLGDLAEEGIEPHARIASLDELVPALGALGLTG